MAGRVVRVCEYSEERQSLTHARVDLYACAVECLGIVKLSWADDWLSGVDMCRSIGILQPLYFPFVYSCVALCVCVVSFQ